MWKCLLVKFVQSYVLFMKDERPRNSYSDNMSTVAFYYTEETYSFQALFR
jgi:hypothetical protein